MRLPPHSSPLPAPSPEARALESLFALLSAAIRDQEPRIPVLTPQDWDRVTALARDGQILPLLYPAVARLEPPSSLPGEQLALWRKTALQAGMLEERRFRETLDILEALASRGIRCIAFKGIALRELYPHSGLRTMGDADLLVRREELPAAEETLRSRGLRQVGASGYHHSWSSGSGSLVELHLALFEKPLPELERSFFDNAVSRRINGRTLWIPAPGDAAFFQVLHMAKHLRYLGFGIRELADLVLQIERGADGRVLLERLDEAGAGLFGRVVLQVCRERLALAVPESLVAGDSLPRGTVSRLTADILGAGVHGRENLERALALSNLNMKSRRWRFLLWLAFPPAAELEPRYRYARTRAWLLPAAWAHRLLRGIATAPSQLIRAVAFSVRNLFRGNPRRRLLTELGLLN
jgi:hypothetical protein